MAVGTIAGSARGDSERSSDFLDTIGINTHLFNTTTAYGDFDRVVTALDYLGITHVRDTLIDRPEILDRIDALGEAGITFNFFLSHEELTSTERFQWQIDAIAERSWFASAIEGPNETDHRPIAWDGLSGLKATRALMIDLSEAVGSAPELAHLPIVQASFARPGTFDLFGDLSQWVDATNTHIYYNNAVSPEFVIEPRLEEARQAADVDRAITTEAGYHTATEKETTTVGVTQEVQAKLVTRLVLEQYRHEIERTFLYELLDYDTNGALDEAENHWGLFESDGTPKDAAHALHALTTLLAEEHETFELRPLDYALDSRGSVHDLMFQTGEDSYALVLWNEVGSWNADTDTQIDVTPVTARIDFVDYTVDGEVFDILNAPDIPVGVFTDSSTLELLVPDHPVIVRLSGVGPAEPKSVAATDTIAVRVSGDSWHGAPMFRILVDGEVVADGLEATADHDSGAWQDLVIETNLGADPGLVEVEFYNDAYGSSADTDRNLYIAGLTVDGVELALDERSGPARLLGDGTLALSGNARIGFDVSEGTTAPPEPGSPLEGADEIILRVAADSWRGDPQFRVLLGDEMLEETYAATAARASGMTTDVRILGDFDSDTLTVRFFNDAWNGSRAEDRNLHVESVTVNGTVLAGDKGIGGAPGPAPGTASGWARLNGNGDLTYALDDLLATAPANLAPAVTDDAPDGGDLAGADLTLRVSGDTWEEAPRFRVFVDGEQVGKMLSATASHGAGEWQDFVIDGDFSAASEVRLRFVNDGWGDVDATDRNLYIDRISLGDDVYEAEQVPGATQSEDAAVLLYNSDLAFLL